MEFLNQTIQSASILYVEDNRDIREELFELLREEVHFIETAENGEEGLEKFQLREYDVVISDIDMPKLDGLSMAEKIKEFSPNTPIILTTAFNEPDLLIQAINIGIDRYIKKPIDLEELFTAIYKSTFGAIEQKRGRAKDNIIRMILENSPEHVILFQDRNLEFANQSLLEFFNFNSLKELQKCANDIDSFLDLLQPMQRDLLESIFTTNSSLRDDITITAKNSQQEEKNLLVNFKFFDDLDKKLLSFVDVTKLTNEKEFHKKRALKAESQYKRTKELLEIKARTAEMGEMINAIAHQWRQPLGTLSMLLGDLTDSYEFGELNGDYLKNFYKSGIAQIKYMNQTIEDFRNFLRPNKTAEIFKPTDSIEFVLRLFIKHYQNAEITFEFNIKNEKLEVIGFQNEFNQVIINIFNNARDAFIEREISTRLINISIFPEDESAKIVIEDNAGGIPEDVIEKIFEPYVTTKGDEGTGIGLDMSKTIIENMNGTIKASSTLEGATFTITLPMKRG